jgi:hypothetical protein
MQSITLQTNDTIVVSGDILGRVQFAASAESDGGASRLAGPGILGMAEGSYGASSNPASLVFATSAADGNEATNRIKISHEGNIVPIGGSYDIGQPNGYGFNNLYVSGIAVDGKVGIGTDSPSHTLTVKDSSLFGGILVSGATNPGVTIVDSTDSGSHGIYGSDDGKLIISSDITAVGSSSSINFSVRDINTVQASITSSGVGIGTTTPDHKLEVVGNILAGGDREVKIDSGTTGGFISKKGDTGAWAFSIDAHGSSDTVHKGFGFLGSADALSSIWIGGAYNTPYAKFTTAETVLNENGANRDFRVEGDTDQNLLFLDASKDSILIGASTDGSVNSKLHVYEANKTNSTYSRTVNVLGRAYSTTDGSYFHIGLNSRAEKYLSASTTDGGYCIGINAVPVIYSPDGTNTLAELTAVRANMSINTAASNVTVTNAFDIKTIPSLQGTNNTVTNHYGLYLSDAGGGNTTVTNEYGVYQVSTDAKNYFGGTLDVRGAAVFNEGGADVDFRVEGDTDTDLLFVDAGNDIVQIGKLSINGAFTLPTADGSANQILKTDGSGAVSWSDAASGGSTITLTAGDGLSGGGDTSADRSFAVNVDDSTIEINSDALRVKDGAITSAKIGAGGFVFNEAGAEVDFRVEGNTEQNLLFIDGSADKIGISTNTPASLFHIRKDSTYNSENTHAIKISDGNDPETHGMLLGVDSTNDVSVIQSMDPGTSWARNLALQAMGGNVGIGTISPSKKLHVVGDLLIDDGSAIILDANGLKITDDTVGATLDTNLDDAIVIGEGSKSYADKSINIANGRFSSDGDCQKITQVLRGSTTNANIFYLSNDGSTASLLNSSGLFLGGTQYNSDHVLLPDSSVFTFTIHVSCRKQSSDDSAAFIIKGAVRNSLGWTDGDTMFTESNASSTRNYHLIDSPIIESFIDSGLAGVTATVTTSYLNPQTSNTVDNLWFGVEVKGLAGTNLRWSAMVDGILTTY